MKRLPVFSSLLAALAPLPMLALAAVVFSGQPAHAEPANRLTVTITNITEHRGTIRLGLFDEAGYAADQAVNGAEIKVTGALATAEFSGLAPGSYGVKLFHDIDDNGKMNTNPFGMPVEPFAFSNNARGQFGPPGWQAAAFEVGAGETSHTIALAGE